MYQTNLITQIQYPTSKNKSYIYAMTKIHGATSQPAYNCEKLNIDSNLNLSMIVIRYTGSLGHPDLHYVEDWITLSTMSFS